MVGDQVERVATVGARVDAAVPRAHLEPGRVVLVITGDGLKTLDAVRGSFETHVIEPSYSAFEREFAGVA